MEGQVLKNFGHPSTTMAWYLWLLQALGIAYFAGFLYALRFLPRLYVEDPDRYDRLARKFPWNGYAKMLGLTLRS